MDVLRSMQDKASSVEDALTRTRIYDHDEIRLSADAHLDGDVLTDRQTGSRLVLNVAGRRVVEHLASSPGATLASLTSGMVQQGAEPSSAGGDVRDFLIQLDRLCLIEIEGAASPFIGLRDLVRTRGMSLLSLDLVELARGGRARRFTADGTGLLRACIRAQGIVVILAVVFTAVLGVLLGVVYGATDFANVETVMVLVVAPAMIGVVHLATLYLHELGHMVVARFHRARVFSVVTRGRRVGMRRERVSPRSDIQISAAGPLLAGASCLAGVGILQGLAPGFGLTTVTGMMSACFLLYAFGHLVSLTPVAEDGRNIARSLHRELGATSDGVAAP